MLGRTLDLFVVGLGLHNALRVQICTYSGHCGCRCLPSQQKWEVGTADTQDGNGILFVHAENSSPMFLLFVQG